MIRRVMYALIAVSILVSCEPQTPAPQGPEQIENPTNQVILRSEIVWQVLNPARGDQSPQAGTIWGDRNGGESTGFLAKFVDGFSSPPHIHNVTYRAVVIDGLVHNDDPNAAMMWMQPGSFWTQPGGEAHITAADGNEVLALVEINEGPYLVKPAGEAVDNGEKPINIDASNIVWLNSEKSNWVSPESEAEISLLLSERDGFKSLFVMLPQGFDETIETDGTVVHAVVIQGELDYKMPQNNETKTLDKGSYFSSSSKAIHTVSNTGQNVVLYLRTNGSVKVN